MLRKNKDRVLVIAIFSVLILITIIARIAYKSSFAIDTDLSKLDSDNGAIISINEKIYKVANKYDAEGLNKLKVAIDSLEDKTEYEELYKQIEQALFEIENSDNAKSVGAKVEEKETTEDTSIEETDTTKEDEETVTEETTDDDDKKDDTTDVQVPPLTKAPAPMKLGKEVNRNEYIYLDLNAGTIKFNGSTYSGYVFETIDGNTTTKTV